MDNPTINEYILGTRVTIHVIVKNGQVYLDPDYLSVSWKAGKTGTPTVSVYGTDSGWTRLGQGVYELDILPTVGDILTYYTVITTGIPIEVTKQRKFYVKTPE